MYDMSLLGWAIVFLILAFVAALFGFGLVAGMSLTIAKWLFVIFVVLFVASFVYYLINK